jgi:hypothetical protein
VRGDPFFQSCVGYEKYLEDDPPLKVAAIQLATDYLNEQLVKTYGTHEGMKIYGRGAVTINLLRGYNIEGTGYDAVGTPAVFCLLRIGNQTVGVFHQRFALILNYHPKLRREGDKYLGLRILEVRKTRERTSPTLRT